MSGTFRASEFIDFNAGVVFATPDTLYTSMPQPWSIDDKIRLFECRVEVWQLGPAVAILKQIEANQPPSIWSHAAYGLVWILTSYFEMIGKSLNPNSRTSGTAGEDFAAGFRDVYPHYTLQMPDGRTLPDARLQHAWTVLRNGIYHLGYTKRGVVLHNSPDVQDDFEGLPIPQGGNVYTMALGVNPHSLTRTIVNHFPTFVARLKDTAQTGLRKKFKEFVDDFHAPPPAKPLV
jgi:hypothetical protein